MGFIWRGEEFEKQLKEKHRQRLERAAITLKNAIKENISEPSGHGATPSDPGEMPHKDTGRLRASISHEVDLEEMTARVGTNVTYGKFLELGTSKMAARPYLRPTHEQQLPNIKRILKGK